jgi:hypothetical protein
MSSGHETKKTSEQSQLQRWAMEPDEAQRSRRRSAADLKKSPLRPLEIEPALGSCVERSKLETRREPLRPQKKKRWGNTFAGSCAIS